MTKLKICQPERPVSAPSSMTHDSVWRGAERGKGDGLPTVKVSSELPRVPSSGNQISLPTSSPIQWTHSHLEFLAFGL